MDNAEAINAGLASAAEHLVQLLSHRSLYLAIAESCTAGLAADALAGIPGASSCFWGSFVCYTIRAKIQMLGIGEERLNRYGPVSEETACSMALAALEKSGADIAVSVTGLAGPAGDGSDVPVGTVWIAAALRRGRLGSSSVSSGNSGSAADERVNAAKFYFSGSRNDVRVQAAMEALVQTIKLLEK
jgi:PncC family amidohydrolase